MRRAIVFGCVIVTVMMASGGLTAASQVATEVVTPEEYFGFRPGADRKLLDYDQLISYLELVDGASSRVLIREAGHSAYGRPLMTIFISSPQNLDRLERLTEINRQLALDSEIPEDELEGLVSEGRIFVLTLHSMHSGEVGPAQSVPLLVHRLATTDDPGLLAQLDNVVLVVVPTHNPDGMQMTVEHYRKTLGTDSEGSSLPGIYHRYVGHDNNRDYVTLSQPETRGVNRLFSTELYPHVLLDKHQMGRTGPRYFVPEYHDPIAVNIDEDLWYWSDVFGSSMAKDLGRAGLKGVASHWVFDEYWPGATTTSHWKGVISLLTEAASCKLATPVFVEPTELQVRGKGLAEYKKGVNMPDPWPGGRWGLDDIVNYELVSLMSVLEISSNHREELLRFRNLLCRQEVARGRTEAPSYFVLPRSQRDRDALSDLVRLLDEHGVSVFEISERIEVGGRVFAAGDVVVPLAQPFRAFVKEVMEVQEYPLRHYTPNGQIIKPYDVTSWSLPLNFGLESHEISARSEELESRLQPLTPDALDSDPVVVPEDVWGVLLSADDNRSFEAAFAAVYAGLDVARSATEISFDGDKLPAGSFVISGPTEGLEEIFDRIRVRIRPLESMPKGVLEQLTPRRIGVVETYFHDMDAGWTRFVLDQAGIPHHVLRPGDFGPFDLSERFDMILFPSVDRDVLTKGKQKWGDRYEPSDMPPEYREPIAEEGMQRLRTFITGGGIVVSWGRSAKLFLDGLGGSEPGVEDFYLPALDLSEELEEKGLYVPGSLLAIDLVEDHPLTWGMPGRSVAFSRGSAVFSTSIPIRDTDRRVIGVHPERDILVSGYAEHEELLANRPVIVWLRKGAGQMVLFGFNPQFRASTPATYKLLYNALLLPREASKISDRSR